MRSFLPLLTVLSFCPSFFPHLTRLENITVPHLYNQTNLSRLVFTVSVHIHMIPFPPFFILRCVVYKKFSLTHILVSFLQHCILCHPSDSSVSEVAGIEQCSASSEPLNTRLISKLGNIIKKMTMLCSITHTELCLMSCTA
jgi:hypothetical protein